ncbi:hypothetical protein M3P05_00470 [Sansalvadorimonas sp. 2012CJ34-2]|uniref:Uncharacterized protein n=1 Tax=Parendozoicomonas callyspongiae TaxID=2942213 RepID=A0ABT0PD11_9GAMM|nr:hypothetical protein [Sansalvadorimonas sp. 2012CJ34-2]MCL6268423.1 hypothetical protein [Sansalvadorimonas sp. 2012CJ34-2]
MRLISSFTHSIAHALGLSRSSKHHPPTGPVGNFKGSTVQVIYTQPRHQPPAQFSGHPAGTQLHQRTAFQVPPNTTFQLENTSVSFFSGQVTPGYPQNQSAYNPPPNQAFHHTGAPTQVQRHDHAAQHLGEIAPQRSPFAPPSFHDIGKFGDISIPTTSSKTEPETTPTEAISSKSSPELPPPDPEELRNALFPCCGRINDPDTDIPTLTGQKEAFAQAFAELENHVADIKNLDNDDLDDLLLCFGIDTSSEELHGDELRSTAYEKLNEAKKELEENYQDFKSAVSSNINESLESISDMSSYALLDLWIKYSDKDPSSSNDSVEALRSETQKMLQAVKDDLTPPGKSFVIPEIVVTDTDAPDTTTPQPVVTKTPPPVAPKPTSKSKLEADLPKTNMVETPPKPVVETPAKPAVAPTPTPILTTIFSQSAKSALDDAPGIVGLPDKPTYSGEELKTQQAALSKEIAALKNTISSMLTQLKSTDGNKVSEEDIFQVLKTTGLTRYQKTKSPEAAIQEAQKKVKNQASDARAAFIALKSSRQSD